jgi:HAD superfamily hydrolase (TIGR01450 family)
VTFPSLRGCDQPLSSAYDTALVDLDGVVYIGPNPVDRAAAALQRARDNGMSLAFVTNNASRTPETIAAHLTELGVPASPREVVTSSMAAASLLVELLPPAATVLVVGGDGLHAAVAERGFAVATVDGVDVAGVVQGYGPAVSWQSLAEVALAVQRGVPWVATNLDSTLPSPRGLLPGNGALVAAVTTATGREPISAGKPELPLHEEAVRRSGARRPIVVGDRLDTDIEGAARAGVDSLLVLSGVTDPPALLAASPAQRPSYIAWNLDGLNDPHPDVVRIGDEVTCGQWAARLNGDHVEILDGSADNDSDVIDGLRAWVVAAWSKPAMLPGIRGDQRLIDALGLGG